MNESFLNEPDECELTAGQIEQISGGTGEEEDKEVDESEFNPPPASWTKLIACDCKGNGKGVL